MIKEIKIENFKSIESLNLELGRLNVFIGANGSGKSNILEGIAFGSAAMEEKVDYEFLANRGIRIADYSSMKSKFDSNQLNNPIFIKWKNEITSWSMLIQNDEKNHDSWKVNGSLEQEIKLVEKKSEKLLKKQFKDNSWIEDLKKSNNDVEDFYVKNFLSAFIDLIEHNGFEPTTMKIPENIRPFFASQIEKNFKDNGAEDFLNFFIFTPENYFLRRFEEEGQIKPLGIRGEGLFSHIVKIFREKPDLFKKINEHLQLLDWFDGFEIPNDLMFTEKRIKIKDRFLEDGLQYFDQRSANEGFLYLLFYLTLFISDETPKFFAIDNIDNAMNPKMGSELIKILAKLAKEHDKQTILTTHNPSVLDGLDLIDDDQRLFVIYRNADGHTKARRITSKEVPNGVESVRLSEAFIRGYIGGLPKNF